MNNSLQRNSKCLCAALSFALFTFSSGILQASPIPGVGTSRLSSQQLGLFFIAHGFRLALSEQLELDPDSRTEAAKGELSMRLRLKDRPTSSSILLTTDQLKSDVKFESYSHKWLKEYVNYGFEIHRTQKLVSKFGKGWLVDFFQRGKNKEVRQIILNHESQIAIITCTDEMQAFDKTAVACGQIYKDLTWITN